jgi:hypothetical protein
MEENNIETSSETIKNNNTSKSSNSNTQAISNESKVVQTEIKEKQSNNNEENKVVQENTNNSEIKKQEEVSNKQEEVKVDENKQERVVTFKQNDTYIQKIKSYLTNHESEDMKQYGYNIQIDSSIVNMTSGFTYSELNMSGYTNKAGTIRIYARDYYLNGNYVETQCFVL